MEKAFAIENLTFTYPGRTAPALTDVSLNIEAGAFVTLCGPSGGGKTTLLRQLKAELTPHGVRSGSIRFEGVRLEGLPPAASAAAIGFVSQSPESQLVTDKVWHELAFGLESLGRSTPEIRLRVAEMAAFFGIEDWFYRDVSTLSGGQKQLLALASVMAMGPRVLVLDEPTARLDPIAASEFLGSLGKINRELGVTIVLSEHRLEEALPLSTRAVVLDRGRVVADGTAQEVGLELRARRHSMFAAMPAAMRIWSALSGAPPCPVTIREGRAWLREAAPSPLLPLPEKAPSSPGAVAVELKDVWFRYEKESPDVVRGLSLTAHRGRLTALLGGNGAGKTTCLGLMSGLLRPIRGTVTANGKVAVLPQNPHALFVRKTVEEDLLEALSGEKMSKTEALSAAHDMARLCRLDGLLDSHPYDLSGGEQQRVALAKVLLCKPDILLLDEPTKGFDAAFKAGFAALLKGLAAQGVAVILVSHDVDFCAEHADTCALMFDGHVVSAGTARDFFSGNSFYTSAANRMMRHLCERAVTVDDAITVLGGTPPGPPSEEEDVNEHPAPPAPQGPAPPAESRPRPPRPALWRTALTLLIPAVLIPLTIYLGTAHWGGRRYYFVALLIMLETMIPLAMAFEGRRPRARELVLLAVLCAIAVTGRGAFFMLPQFKPTVALIIIAGVALGGEAGFLVGAMAAFVSNFFFGQGPWTPWQMFAMGAIGLLAGVLFCRGPLSRSRATLAIFGGLTTLIIYGGIMNPAAVLMNQTDPSAGMFLVAYAQGLPFDLVHAAATVTFILLLARPMLEKLDRVMIKFGLRT